MGFKGKVVIVTGASSGIGAAIAIKFAENGAHVVIVGRNEAKLQQTAKKCEAHGVKLLKIIADVMKNEDVKKIVSDTIKQFSKIDILINNAGIAGSAAIDSSKAMETFERIFATNLRSVVYLTHLASQHLIKTKGNIINISSVASLDVISPGQFSYCTAKAGLDHFSRSAALDLGPKGVRVNTVNPGPVMTGIFGNLASTEDKIDDICKELIRSTVLGRMSEPEEIADLVIFLASEKAKAITGSNFVLDNGMLLNRDLHLSLE